MSIYAEKPNGFFDDGSGLTRETLGESANVRPRSRESVGNGELCWHCCHPFDWTGLPMPIDYDPRRDVFTVVGNFCGIGCMKAYNGTRLSHRREVNYTNISLFSRRYHGRHISAPAAPSRNRLAAFGGALSIEEFRALSSTREEEINFEKRKEPDVLVVREDFLGIPSPPDDVTRSLPTNDVETFEKVDFYQGDCSPKVERRAEKKEGSGSKKKAPAKPKNAPRKRATRETPTPTDDVVLKLKKSKSGEEGIAKRTDFLAMSMGIEISEIPPGHCQ